MSELRRDLYTGTASYYARHRPPYPEALFHHLQDRCRLDGTGRLLDLGCGPGRLGLPLARWFEQLVGMDPEPEMLAEAAAAARRLGISNVVWLEGSSETLGPHLGRFRLVTMGQSFHWMKREAVLEALFAMVDSGGGIVVVDEEYPDVPENAWRRAAMAVVGRWLDAGRRAEHPRFQAPVERHEAVIARSAFAPVEIYRFRYQRPRDVESIIGYLASTSWASRRALGDDYERFQDDVQRVLLEINPAGTFVEDVQLDAILAWKA